MATERIAVPFLDSLRASGLLTDAQLAELAACPEARDPAPTSLAHAVLERGWLTRFQLNMVATGRAGELTIGPYTLLDRVGEGGMGTVYKARHRHLRPRRRPQGDPPGSAGQSRHGQTLLSRSGDGGGSCPSEHRPGLRCRRDAAALHFLAMEFVAGVDLSQLGQGERAAAAGAGVRLHPAGGAGLAARPREGPGPPRHQAEQPPASPAQRRGRAMW